MKKVTDLVKDIQITERTVPWILLAACLLAFGPLLPQLGFFQDDWNVVFNHYKFGSSGILDLFQFDGRPFASWIYLAGFPLLGYNPFAWHLGALTMRWLTSVLIWLVFRELWPNSGWQTLTATLIFVLYPFFTLQPLATTFIHHWIGYFLYALSIYLMLQATKRRFWQYSLLALFFQTIHLFTLEFYAGIDLLRPVFLWLVLAPMQETGRDKLKSVLRQWIPYLVVFTLFFIWRGFFYQAAAEGRNTFMLLTAFLSEPFITILTTIKNSIPDLALILISSWYKILEPANLDFSRSANRFIFLLSIISFGLFIFFFSKQKFQEGKDNQSAKHFLIVGVIALLLSLLPVYAAGYVIHTKNEPWNSRFSLGSLLGAALIIAGLIDYVIKVPKTRWIFLSTIFGLLIGWHLHYTNDFRWAWDKQVDFYRQLYLRAPAIKPNTAILSEEELFSYMGDYPTAYGVNLIYTPQGNGFENLRVAEYWFIPLAEFYTTFGEYLEGRPFSATRAGTSFNADPEGSFVVSFEPGLGQCLWVMRPEYASSKSFSQTMRQLVLISNVDRIEKIPYREDSFLMKYLYTNPEQDWCYYYQKADLAYQYEEWGEVIQLWESAEQNELQPKNGFEYLPFIEAYAHSGDWSAAEGMTRTSQKTLQGIDPLLCDIWSKLEKSTPASTERDNVILSIKEDLRCDQG
jgi:hypothetical protein